MISKILQILYLPTKYPFGHLGFTDLITLTDFPFTHFKVLPAEFLDFDKAVELVGVEVGEFVGVTVGVFVGVPVGVLVGVSVGVSVGVIVGVLVGVWVGVVVGVWVGV